MPNDFNTPQQPQQKQKVWATLITKENDYIISAKVLAFSLLCTASKYPLVIMHTKTVSKQSLDELLQFECQLRQVEFLEPPKGVAREIVKGYNETWTKLRAWGLTEFERVALLDADMLVMHNMDELLDDDELLKDENWLAASNACTCNPGKNPEYPKTWVPESCVYTPQIESDSNFATIKFVDYFNSGMLVLKPNDDVFARILKELYNHPNPDVLIFPDQDFLNEAFKSHWVRLPYIYNALKTLRNCHSNIWNDDQVKNIHYILDKPWRITDRDSAEAKSNQAYVLNLWWFKYFDEMKKFEESRSRQQ
ncbi:8103_t:CDS:2 [Ambispora gerdemannii]|uniref:8103_t:CDS:1 n=1 Tax=Ambispora gerdemannii TaxID=144530 RepID=A0A9N8UXG0_9GLOM|nr:8103_t:CDS:2 [Ambispora gerdemannii]